MHFLVGLVIVIGLVGFAFGAGAARNVVRAVLSLAVLAVLAFVAYVVWDVIDIDAWLEMRKALPKEPLLPKSMLPGGPLHDAATIVFFTSIGLLALLVQLTCGKPKR
jgi:hypothetical protein